MSFERLNAECIKCLLNKNLYDYPEDTSNKEKITYMKEIMNIVINTPLTKSAPEIVREIVKLKEKMFGIKEDYGDIKTYFNNLIMKEEKTIEEKIKKDKNPLRLAIQYSMAGNYIDFGAVNKVTKKDLYEILSETSSIEIRDALLQQFENEIKTGKRLTYLTDNCGEIVLDKILIKTIKNYNSNIKVDVIVRGFPVINDATIKDAKEIGLTNICEVTDNGTDIAGTVLDKINEKSLSLIENADVIISKGQANFETLRMCNKNIYYLFLCKCDMFAKRFSTKKFTGIFVNDYELK